MLWSCFTVFGHAIGGANPRMLASLAQRLAGMPRGSLLFRVPVRIEALEMSLHASPGAGGRDTPVGRAVKLAAFGAEARIIPKAHSPEFGGLVRRRERFSDRSGPLRRDRVTGPIGASRAAIPEDA